MGTRRDNGQGTIYTKMRNGKQVGWHGKLQLPSGKRTDVYGKTKREVERKLADLRREVDAGLHGTRDAETTVKAYLEQWLVTAATELEPKTVSGYRGYINNRIGPIAHLSLNAVKPTNLQKFYATLLKTYAPTTVNHTHDMLSVAFNAAVRLGLIPRNPCDLVKAPAVKIEEFKTLRREQVTSLIAAACDDAYGPLVALTATTGIREAEVLGLTWDMIDWERGTVQIAQTLHVINGAYELRKTKSRASRRTLPLAPAVIALLKAHRVQQDDDRAFVGEAWDNTWDLIFRNQVGRPLHYNQAIRHFYAMLSRLGIPRIRFHDLRHTFATLLIEDGVPIHVVSMLLGHSGVSITLQTYAHVTPRMHSQATASILSWLPEGTLTPKEEERP